MIQDDILCKKEVSKNTLIPIINENKYILTAVIELTFSLETTDYSTILSIDYNLDGFEFAQEPEIDNDVITIKLLVLETSDIHRLAITVHLSDLSIVTSKIYGYIDDNYIYISGCSFEAARDIYLTEALTNSTITQREYEEIINYRIESNEIISNKPEISFLSDKYSISGTLQWQDDSGNIHPLQYICVSLYCANDSDDNNLKTVYTDLNGFYNFTIPANLNNVVFDNLYIKVSPMGKNVIVNTGTGGEYIWRSSIYDRNISGDNIIINRTFNMRNTDELIDGVAGDGDLGRALQISQALIYADKFAATMNGSSLKKIRARYPVSDGTKYNSFWKRIDLLGIESDYDYADWDVIFHEYGHHIQNMLGNANNPGGKHSSNTDLSLTRGIDEGTRLAWGEAWPTIFGEIAQQYYSTYLSNIAGVADGGYTDSGNRINPYPLPSFKYNRISNSLYNNEAIERAIMGVLYDLYDDDEDESHDNVALGARDWWSATVVSGITTFMNFSDQYYFGLSNEIDKNNYCKLVQHYGMPATLYDYTTNGAIILARYKLVGECIIPKRIFNYIIYSICEEAFKNQSLLISVKMSNSNVINIDSSAFENCISLKSVLLHNDITSIGASAFKGCASLESISIPNSVTHIDTSAFEGCSYLQSVTLSNNLIAIGSSAFKGCASLARITIPNTVTNIDTSAFENCSYLQSVTLSNNLIAIGSSAFKGCGSLGSITIPSSVQHIDSNAFENCSSLSVVTVNRRITNITNLGVSVFDGCNASLKIIVPTNRIAEYKNKEHWSSYRNKIMPSEDYTEFEIDCEGNVTDSLSLSKATNELYKLNVNCSKSYKINANSSNNVNIIIYDSNMNVISSGSNTLTQFLDCGIYYISFEFDDTNASGTFEIGISLTWTSSNILLNKGTNNIKNSMHLNNGNAYHCSYEYFNNQGEGFYRFSLNIGSNEILPEGTIKIYSNINKTELLNRYGSTGINEQAITYDGENELYVFLPENGYYYIDIALPKSTYSLITLTIEQIEQKDINYQNRLDTNTIDELFDNKTNTNYFEEVTISHRSKIELDIVTSGTINRNIPIYIFEKHRDPGYEPGDNHYYLVLEYTNNITSINKSPIFTIILNPGTYYIGYSDNFDKVQIQFALRRKVNTDLNIDGTLVTDPARNQGFPLGSEVTFNDGALLGNTITEGFTRNLYLMVEDRLRDPMSRLDYDWYSSNENVAIVTKYGTVLALNVNENTTVTIYAINKDDPSIVYKKDFVILKETKTEQLVIECNMTYSYSEENGMYTLELDFTNCPYPYIGYYVWDIESFNGISVDMEHYGLIYSTGPGEALLTANYILNMRIFLKIHLTITE